MQTSGWRVVGAAISLVSPSGEIRTPSTDEVYRALVERQPSESWIPDRMEGVKASRYPLTPTLVVSDDGTGAPRYSIKGTGRNVELSLSVADLERGHIVSEGIWHPIEPSAASEVLDLMRGSDLEASGARSLRGYLAVRKAASSSGDIVKDEMADHVVSALVFAPKGDDVPTGVLATLYSYQLDGWRWLKFLMSEGVGGLLADEMGLGKTLQIISALSDPGISKLIPALIIAPGSLLENWCREFSKFAPHIRVMKHHGPLRTGRPADLEAWDVVVTSYDTAVGDNSLFNMIDWQVVVLDEAQFIRNPEAQRTKAVKRIPRRAGLAVTGTPVENRLLDLWSIIDFVLPGHLADAKTFEATFPDNQESAIRLEPLISPLMLRRKVADVATDLPPRIDIPQVMELNDSEAAAYDHERESIFREYGAAATLVALTSLRRFCAHPALMGGNTAAADPMSFSKFRRLDEIVEEIFVSREKVIIFTSFTAMADMIARHIEERFGTFVGTIDGRLAIDERQPLIDRFGAFSGPAALVLNPKAGGAGLNITAANHVIHYNPEWNPALEDQASARSHRRGQTRPVTVHRLLVANTVEDVVDERLTRKRVISGAAVIGVEGKEEDYDDIVAALVRSPSRSAHP